MDLQPNHSRDLQWPVALAAILTMGFMLLVVSATSTGPAILERLRAGDPDPAQRQRHAALAFARPSVLKESPETLAGLAAVAGPASRAQLMLAGVAEGAGHEESVRRWLAVDASRLGAARRP